MKKILKKDYKKIENAVWLTQIKNGDSCYSNDKRLADEYGLEYNETQEWNGYGYTISGRFLEKGSKKIAQKEAKIIIIELEKRYNLKFKTICSRAGKQEKEQENPRDHIEKWARRLAKFTEISIKEAEKIADEKLNYQQQIEQKVKDKTNWSNEKSIKFLERIQRTNPLRTIKDETHAQSILEASNRHNNTHYEDALEDAKSQAQWGLIDRANIKATAKIAVAPQRCKQ